MNRAWKLIVTLASASLFWCVAVGLLLWFLPLGSSVALSGGTASASGGQSFAEVSQAGPWPLLVPIVLVALAEWAACRHRRLILAAASLLAAAYAFLTGFSIGVAYVPAALALIVASLVALSAAGAPAGQRVAHGRGA